LNALIDRFGAEFTVDELKDLSNKTKSMHQAKSKEEKEKAAVNTKKKGGKKGASKKSVVVERDELAVGRDDDVFYDEDDY
jgi:hypothetical protein